MSSEHARVEERDSLLNVHQHGAFQFRNSQSTLQLDYVSLKLKKNKKNRQTEIDILYSNGQKCRKEIDQIDR